MFKILYKWPDDGSLKSGNLQVVTPEVKELIERDLLVKKHTLAPDVYEKWVRQSLHVDEFKYLEANKILTEAAYKKHVWYWSVPPFAIDPMLVDADIHDFDNEDGREFRNAWVHEDGKIVHDLEKARNLQLEKMRRARVPLMQKLDTDYMRAMESGDTDKIKDIIKSKQTLRDVTEVLKKMELKSIDDVKGAWDKVLG